VPKIIIFFTKRTNTNLNMEYCALIFKQLIWLEMWKGKNYLLPKELTGSGEGTLALRAPLAEDVGGSTAAAGTEEEGVSAAAAFEEEVGVFAAAAFAEEVGVFAAAAFTEEVGVFAAAAFTEEVGVFASAVFTEDVGFFAAAAFTEEVGVWAAAAFTEEVGVLASTAAVGLLEATEEAGVAALAAGVLPEAVFFVVAAVLDVSAAGVVSACVGVSAKAVLGFLAGRLVGVVVAGVSVRSDLGVFAVSGVAAATLSPETASNFRFLAFDIGVDSTATSTPPLTESGTVTRCFFPKIAQNVAQSIFCHINYETFSVEASNQFFRFLCNL
jgi:hypothetical protein